MQLYNLYDTPKSSSSYIICNMINCVFILYLHLFIFYFKGGKDETSETPVSKVKRGSRGPGRGRGRGRGQKRAGEVIELQNRYQLVR